MLDPTEPERAEIGLLEIAQQAGCVLVHVDNVDGAEAAVVVELLAQFPVLPAIVTGRYKMLPPDLSESIATRRQDPHYALTWQAS